MGFIYERNRKMANSLNVNLDVGEIIELNDGRIVTVRGGFGMASFTTGQALLIEDANGNKGRVSGFDIKRLVKDSEDA